MTRAKLMFYFGHHGSEGGEREDSFEAPSKEFFRKRVGAALEEAAERGRPCAVIHEMAFRLDEEDHGLLLRVASGRAAGRRLSRKLERLGREMEGISGKVMESLDKGESSEEFLGMLRSTFGYIDAIIALNRSRPGAVANHIEPQTLRTLEAGLRARAASEMLIRALGEHALRRACGMDGEGFGEEEVAAAKDMLEREFASIYAATWRSPGSPPAWPMGRAASRSSSREGSCTGG